MLPAHALSFVLENVYSAFEAATVPANASGFRLDCRRRCFSRRFDRYCLLHADRLNVKGDQRAEGW